MSQGPSRGPGGSRAPDSIRSFLTDGSLAALCAELGRATGARVRLRDEHGLVLTAWGRADEPGADEPVPEGAAFVPLVVDGERIGQISIEPDDAKPAPEAHLVVGVPRAAAANALHHGGAEGEHGETAEHDAGEGEAH